ncbi:FtsH protease activity modulator HflK [Bacillus carboniphilus]|uniref:Protein HflK n=1 Tax=Bacillus carboniphilus TaxID=86663 RepID=A0ABY9K0F1_9BACI|nr:FtsH protease activity modulator HflK [Bacillus carboniphilus]WLR44160.1 FtsH protease activity modulator HflK [Bacillus carboniphilus]
MSLKSIYKIIGLFFVIIVLGIVAFTSWYTVDESEQAVIITFGEVEEGIIGSGLHFKMPWPIQTVEKLSKETFSLQFGYEEKDGEIVEYPKETKMITGDEKIVLADMVVQWKITDPKKFLFNSEAPKDILHDATSASLRSIIGSSEIDDALTSGKLEIEAEVQDLLTELIEKYDVGISILAVKLQDVELPNEEVRKAFTAVTDSRETKNTKIKEAEKYSNQKKLEAEGERDAIISAAQGDKTERIETAKGEVALFNSVYEKYTGSKEVTEKRLILETIDEVLPDATIYMMKDDGSTMKYFPITDLQKSKDIIPAEEGSDQNEQ